MARNIEIKARVLDRAALAQRAAELADTAPQVIHQDDTFFRCEHGRLKLRELADGRGELIFYRRPDARGPKTSHYQIVPTEHPAALREALAAAQGLAGRVVKRRTLYRVGRTRIHLDEVQGLGDHLELEVVLAEDEDEAVGRREAQALMAALGVPPEAWLEGAYVDLLRWQAADASGTC